MLLKTKIVNSNSENISFVASQIKKGKIVALPTETVYGLAGRFDNDKTIKKIFEIKNRPSFNPLILHYGSIEHALEDIHADTRALDLAKEFWPGPLTIVGKIKNKSISKLATAGLNTVAIRVPSNKTAIAVLKKTNIPIAAPSANRAGKISPTSARDVLIELEGKIETILNGGPSKIGVESTIVDLSGKQTNILRFGGIDAADINDLVKINNKSYSEKQIISPGLSKSHYKPDKKIRINANKPENQEGWLAFGKIPKKFNGYALSLSERKCLYESARNLYKMLRLLDKKKVSSIAVQKIPKRGIGLAINDRLERAAFKE